MNKKIVLLVLFALPFLVRAGNYTTIANGKWSNSAIWSGGIVPSASDTVTIANVDTLNASESIKNITINSSKSLTVNSSSTLSVYGNFTDNGTFTYNTGTVAFVGSGNQTISGSGTITFYNLTVNPSSVSDTLFLNKVIAVNYNLTISQGVLDCETYKITGSTLGTMTMASGTTLVLGLPSSSTLPGFPSNYTYANISLNVTSNVVYQADNTSTGQTVSSVPYYGNVTVTTSNAGTSTVSSLFYVRGNLNINSAITFATTTTTDSIKGDLTISSGATYKAYSAKEYLFGNLTNNGTYKEQSGGECLFVGHTNQTISSPINVPINTMFNELLFEPTVSTDSLFIEANLNSTAVIGSTTGVIFVPAAYNDTIELGNGLYNAGAFTALNGVCYFKAEDYTNEGISINPPTLFKIAVNVSLDLYANIKVSSDLVHISGAINFGSDSVFLKGNYINSSTTASTTTGGGLVMDGNHNQTIGGSVYPQLQTIVVDESSVNDTVTLDDSILCDGIRITKGTLDVSSGNNNIVMYGSFINNSVFLSRGGTITNPSANAVSIGGSVVTSFNNIAITGTATFTLGNNEIVNKNLIISSGKLDVSTSNYNLTLGGNFTNNGTFTERSGTVTLNGTNQVLSGTGSLTFYNLTQKQASSTDSVFMGRTITVSHNFIDSAGVFDCQNHTMLGNTTGVFTLLANTGLVLGIPSSINNVKFPTAFTTLHTTISSSSTINYRADTAQVISNTPPSYGNLIVGTGSTATAKTLAANTTINGNLIINANTTLDCEAYQIAGNSTGIMSMASGSGLILGSTSSSTAITFPTGFVVGNISLNSTSTVTYQANANQTISTTPPTYGNLVLSTSSSKTPASSPLDIAGNLTINVSTTLPETTGTINLTGNLTNSGTLSFSSSATPALNISGNFTNNGTFTYGTSTTTFNGSSGQSISGTSYPTFYNLTISGGSSETVSLGGTQTITDSLKITSGSLDAVPLLNYNVTIGGNFSITGGSFIPRLGTVTMNGGTQNLGGSVTLSLNTLVLGNGSTTEAATLKGNIVTASNITISNHATLNASNHTITTAGNFIDNGTFTPSTSTVYFDNNGHQCIEGSTSPVTFQNMTLGSLSILGNTTSVTLNGTVLVLPGGRMDCSCP